jgi:hypothetical protein
MKHVVLIGALALGVAIVGWPATRIAAQTATAGTSLGTVNLTRAVNVGGMRLAAGSYQIRLTTDQPPPAVGQSPDSERFVEFVRGGKVVVREAATVVSNADIGTIVKGPRPATGGSRVDLLKGNDYLRVWINRGGSNYLIHLPVAT